MTDGHDSSDGAQAEPTADECVRAGMYWFGRSDFQAAQAWWQRAIELDPQHTRAQECLRLLTKTSATGFKGDAVNPFEAPTAAPAQPQAPNPASNPAPSWQSPAAVQPQPQAQASADRPPGTLGPASSSGSYNSAAAGLRSGVAPVATDPFDFAADAQGHRPAAPTPAPVAEAHTPWDEGPSRTSVVTLQDSGGFDAVPEPTPLPELDRERFFNRGDPESPEDIVSFLRATGDLPASVSSSDGEVAVALSPLPADEAPTQQAAAPPAPAASEPSQEIVFDDPVELSTADEPVTPDPKTLIKEARDRFGLHDFDGVLECIEALPPELQQGEEARNLVAEARRNLLRMYESKIGDFERVPRVTISDEEIIWLNLNHRAGFILSQIDGMVTFEDLVSLSGMPRLDTVRILADLIDKKVMG